MEENMESSLDCYNLVSLDDTDISENRTMPKGDGGAQMLLPYPC